MESALTSEVLIEWFTSAEDQTDDARRQSERDRDYYDGKQLTDKEIAELRKRGQPPVVVNRVARKVDWLCGLEAQRRTDPRAFPRTPDHEQDAEAATDAIRFVCDNNDWDQLKASVFRSMLIEGYGGVEVVHEQTRKGVEIRINRYAWDRLFFDPHSSEPDFSDARYKGNVIWSDAEEIKRRYPKFANDIEAMFEGDDGDTYDDKPKVSWAVDRERKRVRQIVIWYREGGVWKWARFAGKVELERGESPYVDEDGDSMCPLILRAAYVDRDNNRYGVVRQMIDVQDEINKRRSKALHLLTMRQTVGEKGAVDSVAKVKREMADPQGHIEIQPDARFEVLQNQDLTAGQFNLLQEAKNEIDLMGANSDLAGEGGKSQSGRAVLAKQQGGMIEIAPLFDGLQAFAREVYRHIWARIQQFWTEERWVRVTDDERNVRFVGLNQPQTVADKLRELPEQQAVQVAQRMGLRQGDPRLGEVVGVKNAVAEIDVDIVIDEAPEALTLEGETFEQLVKIASSGVVRIPGEMIIESAPGLRRDKKDKIMEAIERDRQQQMQMMQAQAPIEQATKAAEIEKTQAGARKDMASAAKYEADAILTMREAQAPQLY